MLFKTKKSKIIAYTTNCIIALAVIVGVIMDSAVANTLAVIFVIVELIFTFIIYGRLIRIKKANKAK